MCSALQSSSEWSHLNPIRSGAARNTTPVKFSELNSPRMRRVIRIFLEVWLHNNYKRMRRLLDPAMMFFFTDISFHLLDIFSPMVQQGFISFLGLWWTEIHSSYQVITGSSVLFQVIVFVCIYVENAKCWPILAFLSRIHALFLFTFTSLINAVVYQHWQIWSIPR